MKSGFSWCLIHFRWTPLYFMTIHLVPAFMFVIWSLELWHEMILKA